MSLNIKIIVFGKEHGGDVQQASHFYLFLRLLKIDFWVGLMMLNATFNNISVILWQSVLLVEETGVPGENTTSRKSLTNFIT